MREKGRPIPMPTLDFKGKQIVYAHHLTVPARTLEPDASKSLPSNGSAPSLDNNLIIHGDNLHALKALMPRYAGRVHCIYIDPPYNTGNEGWAYNDNVNSPLMQEWLTDKSPVDGLFHETDDWLFYLIYEPDLAFLRSADSALNGDRADRIAKQAKAKQKTAVVFATHKFMGQKELSEMGIVFCGLSYEVVSG